MPRALPISVLFFFNDTATTEIYTLSLHDALPIYYLPGTIQIDLFGRGKNTYHWPGEADVFEAIDFAKRAYKRSEEHTSELQSPCNLVCRLLLEKKKNRRPCGVRR